MINKLFESSYGTAITIGDYSDDPEDTDIRLEISGRGAIFTPDRLNEIFNAVGYELTKMPVPPIELPSIDGAVIDINDNIYQNLVRVKGKWLHVGAGIERTEKWIEDQAAGRGITVLFDGKRGN